MIKLKNKVANNASWIIAGKLGQAILAFIINILTARYLGPSFFGIISYATSIATFLVPIMNLGFSNTLVQEFTIHPEEEGEILGSAILLSIFSSFACMIGIATYTFLVDVNETVTNITVILYSIMLLMQAFELIQYWYQYKYFSKHMAIVSLLAYLVVSIYKFILLFTGQKVYWFAIANSIDYFLIAIALLIIYKKLGGKKLKFNWSVAKRMFSSSKHYIISSLMVTIFAQTDRIMLKLMIDEEAVGFYTAATTCAMMTAFVFQAIIDSFRPLIFENKNNNDLESYEKNIIKLNSIVIYLSLLQSIVMTIFANLIIKIMYGTEYLASIGALQIVVWYTTFSYLGAIRNVWILGENKQKYLWILNLGGALLNIILNYFLIPIWGINGAAVASLITQFFTNVIMNMIVWPLKRNNYFMLMALNPKVIINMLRRKNETNN